MRQRGFTLLELLITLGVVGILAGVAGFSLQHLRHRLELNNAQRTLVDTLNKARSDARRLSVDQTLSWRKGEAFLELASGDEPARKIEVSTSNSIVFQRSDRIRYNAPYGRAGASNDRITLVHKQLEKGSDVIIYGVTGKVKAVAR